MDKLNIGIEIPSDFVTQKAAMIGVTGTGKSNGAGVIVEQFCKAKIPFVLLDVNGAHWGIRELFSITVYGGRKGLFLDLTKGRELAKWVVDTNQSVVFDFSELNDFQMQDFAADFLDELFRLHANKRTPRHVLLEEAEVFCPQTNFDHSRNSLLACNRVMKRGRAFGLGMTLISQRPADLNKKTLSQSQCTFLLHLEGVQEIEVARKMLRSQDKETRESLIDRILHFQKGECLLYSPSWLGKIESFRFPIREAFHAGNTPKLGEVIKEPILKPMPVIQTQVIDKPFEWTRAKAMAIFFLAIIIGVVSLSI